MNKNESKYFNTAIKMDKALISLLEEKDFEYISIKEICETAGVNRSTFYLHYENTSDLLKETTQYIIDDFLTYFSTDEKSFFENQRSCDLEDLVFISPKYLLPYLTYVKENSKIFNTSLKQFGTMNFENVYKRFFMLIFNPVLERFGFPKNERGYVLKFYLTGITAIVMEWIKNDCCESIDTISNIIVKCILGNEKEKRKYE